jgi:hypothetical protein
MRTTGRLSLGLGAVAISTLALAAPAMAATPHAAATPNKHLKNNQTIKVSWSGFPAGAKVAILQCTGKPASQAAALKMCDIKTVKQVTSSAKGAGSTQFKVLTGKIAQQGQCATKSTNCKILVGAQTNPPVGAFAALSFGP